MAAFFPTCSTRRLGVPIAALVLALIATTSAKVAKPSPRSPVAGDSCLLQQKVQVGLLSHPPSPNEPGGEGEGADGLLGDALQPLAGVEPAKGYTEEDTEAAEHEKHSYLGLLFPFGALSCGVLLLMLIERHFPSLAYTVGLFVLGMAVAAVHHFRPSDHWSTWPSWFNSIDLWEHINPHMLMFALLPALIFGEAMRLNVPLVSKCFWQVLTLACPGVLMCTGLTAFIAVHILPYGWDWPLALVFGSILSATDPVAVVALFNTLGVSKRLTMIISGESLLNDGTSIVIFQLMLKVTLGVQISAWSTFRFVAHMSLTSVVFGALLGSLGLVIIAACADGSHRSDAMIQVVVSISVGYLSFFVAEHCLLTSGVLACVTAGFTLANGAWPRLVSKETMVTVWEAIEFMGNTLIFFLAGVLFAGHVLEKSLYIGFNDFLWLGALYVMLMGIRAAVVVALWPFLNAVGAPLCWQEVVVMSWSGLRGAVGLALAMIIDLEPGIDKRKGSLIFFHVGGIAALTMLVNASLAPVLLRRLGLTKATAVEAKIMDQLEQSLIQETAQDFERELAKSDPRFKAASQDTVRLMVPLLQGRRPQTEADSATEQVAAATVAAATSEEQLKKDLTKVYRETLLKTVMSNYWEAINEGIISKNWKVATILVHSAEAAVEKIDVGLSDWEILASDIGACSAGPVSKILSWVADGRLFSWIPGFYDAYSEDAATTRKIQAALCFKDAHERAREEVPLCFVASAAMDNHAREVAASESKAECARAEEEFLRGVDVRLLEWVQSKMLARKLLYLQIKRLRSLEERGLLTGADLARLEEEAQEAVRGIAERPRESWLGKPPQ